MNEHPRPEPLGYLVLVGVLVDVTGITDVVARALIVPLNALRMSMSAMLGAQVGLLEFHIGIACLLLSAYVLAHITKGQEETDDV